MAELHEVIVYSRARCHLCKVVKQTIRRAEGVGTFHWHEVDIDSDPDLQSRFTNEIPVVFIDGKKAFKFRMNQYDFLRKVGGR